MAELTVLEDFEIGKLTKILSCFNMKKIESLKTKAALRPIPNLISKDVVLLQTDESITFSKFEDFIQGHLKKIVGTEEGEAF
jgi:hypothetical protein